MRNEDEGEGIAFNWGRGRGMCVRAKTHTHTHTALTDGSACGADASRRRCTNPVVNQHQQKGGGQEGGGRFRQYSLHIKTFIKRERWVWGDVIGVVKTMHLERMDSHSRGVVLIPTG